jgi:hypothetical protein
MRRGPAARKRFSVEFCRAKIACKNGRVDRGAVSASLQPFSFALIYLVQYHEISIKPTLSHGTAAPMLRIVIFSENILINCSKTGIL